MSEDLSETNKHVSFVRNILLLTDLENEVITEDVEDGNKEVKKKVEVKETQSHPTHKEKIQKFAEPPPLQG